MARKTRKEAVAEREAERKQSKRKSKQTAEVSTTTKKKNTKKRSKRKTAAKVSGVTIVLLLLLVAAGAYVFYSQIVVPTRESERPLSILLVGSDVSDFRDDYFMGTKPEKTDALMVMTFNPNTYHIDMTSIPRDTSVDYVCDTFEDAYGNTYENGVDVAPYQDQINELYQVSGKKMKCLTDTVSNFLNVPIDYYVKVNMDQLADIIDAVGGIDIKVHAADGYLSQENASLTETYSWTDGEKVHMAGDEAVTYARARHDSEKDYGRGLRQQQVVGAIVKQVLHNGLNLKVVDKLFKLVKTDMPIKLCYEYVRYIMDLVDFNKMVEGKKEPNVDVMPDTVWLNLYDMTGFDGDLVGTKRQRNKEVNEFIDYVNSDSVDKKALKSEMIKNHQFYNVAYYGHYNVDPQTLYDISNELRENLELKPEDVTVPQNQYGDNYAYGFMPSETTKAKQGLV